MGYVGLSPQVHADLLARSFFKKWLEIERRIGDEEGAEHVKAKAVEWTQRAAAAHENDDVDGDDDADE